MSTVLPNCSVYRPPLLAHPCEINHSNMVSADNVLCKANDWFLCPQLGGRMLSGFLLLAPEGALAAASVALDEMGDGLIELNWAQPVSQDPYVHLGIFP